ncbi:MAG: choice-of-anchor tandem repeat GloVer-containing protein [Candidatus Korobacteraceae bacterium]
MRISTRFALSLATLLLGVLLASTAARAETTDCPPEPASGTAIDDGEVYAGPNCTLQSPGDVDSFVFTGTSGETYQLAVGINGAAPTNICLTLYDPNQVIVFSGCSSIGYPHYQNSVVVDQMLTVTGTYTIAITDAGSGTLNYAVALERLYPFPPNAQGVNLGVDVSGDINPITDTNAFTFQIATTGRERASATLTGTISQNICMTVYLPDGTQVQNACTSIGYPHYQNTVQIDFLPTQNGTAMAFLQVAGNDGTATYTFEASCLVGTCPAPTETFNIIHTFVGGDGVHSVTGLVQAADGSLYGTTAEGGGHNGGTVFKISGGTLTTLYNFCSQSGCADGLTPKGGLVKASDGTFYGTTAEGGADNYGTIFHITPTGTFSTVYSFNSTMGANPSGGLILASDGELYGTTRNGGLGNRGVVFKVTTSGTPTRLHSFCTQSGCADGLDPRGGLVQGFDGTIYGTTYGGGTSRRGTVFKIPPGGSLSTLYNFDSTHGAYPEAGLALANDGNLYGTTSEGGASHRGTIFVITTAGALTRLFSFDLTHGANPEAALMQASDGNLYGTTSGGGEHDRGTIFQSSLGGGVTTLYSFDWTTGASPQSELWQGMDGNFYGTTFGGGAHDFGLVFSLSIP